MTRWSIDMAQPFRHVVPLIDGQGNFGSIDGDPPAPCATPKAAWTRVTAFLLDDIDKDTVDFQDNYDGKDRSRRSCRRSSRTCWSMARAASPSAWRPTFRRTTWRDHRRHAGADRQSGISTTWRCWRSCRGPTSRPAR
jgi:hypothetical protein